MCQSQPLGQLPGRLFRRGAVEGHHGGRHAGGAPELRPPAATNRGDFDLIQAPGYVFFEMMNVHVGRCCGARNGALILRGRQEPSSEARREDSVHTVGSRDRRGILGKKNLGCQLLHRFCTIHAQDFHTLRERRTRSGPPVRRYNYISRGMSRVLKLLIVFACLAAPRVASAAPDVTLFRLFLLDGNVLVTYGEFVRLEDNVMFSMPVGGPSQEPRLQVATLRSVLVDWERTDRYAASARYQRYAETVGEEDYQRLSNDVAAALNNIALSTDRQQALMLAERVRQMVAAWPKSHYGYRHNEVREIVSVLDQAISTLRAAAGLNPFELSFVAMAGPPELEPVLGMPNARQQLEQIVHLATVTTTASDRMALLQAALVMLREANPGLSAADRDALRKKTERQIRDELEADKRYGDLSRRLMDQATRAAERGDGTAVQRLLTRIPREDAKLGQKRPQLVEALSTSVQGRLTDARRLRLLKDQWTLRLATYRQYQRSVGSSLLLLAKSTSSLEAIRKLDGPNPDQLVSLRTQLSGGAERLQRMRTPEYLRDVHERLVGAWRFAENAARARFTAISDADSAAAWEASSSAAGALMMLARVQQDLRTLLEPPRLQ